MKIGSKLRGLEKALSGDLKKVEAKVAPLAAKARQIAGEVEAAGLNEVNTLRGLSKVKDAFKPGPVLASTTANASGTAPVTLRFQAAASGADFGKAGQESTAVSIFVDGKYHSTQAIFAERAGQDGFGSYQVNLGQLPAGAHRVEIRSANWLAGPKAEAAQVKSVGSGELAGASAEVSRYAPLIVTRRNRVYPEGARSDGRASMVRTDAPLLLRAELTGDPASLHVITYKVTLSDEDSGTPDPERLKVWGRTTDDEWCYRVLVDGRGQKVAPEKLKALQTADDPAWQQLASALGKSPADAAQFLFAPEVVQYGDDKLLGGVHHQPRAFDGARQGDRPLLRVNSGNNNFAAVRPGEAFDTPVWSPEVVLATSQVQRDGQGRVTHVGHLTDKDVIRLYPWIGTLSQKEVVREDGRYP